MSPMRRTSAGLQYWYAARFREEEAMTVRETEARTPAASPKRAGPMQQDDANALTAGLLACGVVGGVGFLAAALAEGAIRSNYSALHQPVSILSLGDAGWIQIANFVVTGLLMIA